MKKYCLKNSLIGNYYPMYLNNSPLGASVYLYQVVTPGMSKRIVPLVSLEKVGEITRKEDFSATTKSTRSIDVISTLLGHSRQDIDHKSVDFLKDILGRTKPVIYTRGPEDFPGIEMGMENDVQKSLIVNLRDNLRWHCYRFYPGRTIDILWTPTQFATFKVEGDKEKIWLSPVALFDNTDIRMANPIEHDFSGFTKKVYTGKLKVSELNRDIKRMEWQSFGK